MKILVTGSLGRIGSRVIPLFPDRFELKLTDIKEGEVNGHPVSVLDITDYNAVLTACQGMDAILHLAITSEGQIVTDVPRFHSDEGDEYLRFNEAAIETNIRGTYHIFEAARQNRVPRVVYGSSLTVFIGSPAYEIIHDDLPPRPSNFYGVTKLWGEQLGEYFSRRHGLTVYCLRFGTPHPMKDAPLLKQWLQAPIHQWTFVSFNDLAGAMRTAIEVEGPQFGAYTIVSAIPGSIFDVSQAAEIGWQPQDRVEVDGSVHPVDPS